MKKALMYASVASMIQQFNMANIDLLIELGYKVDVACNFEFGSTITNEKIQQLKETLKIKGVSFYHIPIPRKLKDVENFRKSYKLTKQLMNNNRYNLIHCHSPIGGLLCREANKNSKHYMNTKMIYTAHGFHFFKGNNMMKNFVFKGVEKYTSKYTDVLITINKEDYFAAKELRLKENGKVKYIPGIGIDMEKISTIRENRSEIISELGISNDSIILISAGELNDNKNHRIIIESLPKLAKNIHYLICGQGENRERLYELAKQLDVDDRLHLLGYRSDVIKLLKSSNIFVFPSKREGLSVALMEAMACGIPCIASNIRGNKDLIENGKNGYLVEKNEVSEYVKHIEKIITYPNSFSMETKDLKMYGKENVLDEMLRIYN